MTGLDPAFSSSDVLLVECKAVSHCSRERQNHVRPHRLFQIAPSLARLTQKARGGEHVQEGYFLGQPHWSTFVQVEDTQSSPALLH